jgi:OmpA-OmpF porin, OOP family
MKKLIISLAMILLSGSFLVAQDAEGCKDHPLLSRMPDYNISECTENYSQLDFYNAKGEDVVIEGNRTHIWYIFNTESGKKEPSYYQIVKNYANAITKIGGKKIYEYEGVGCYELKKNGKLFKIKVGCTNASDILLDVVEMEQMKQDISANDMLIALNKDGYIALNILFETGKSAIQAESLPIVDQIAELLKSDMTLKISIEGHTDNVGDAVSNKKLSNDRAKSVMDAIIAKGIEASRMTSTGWGQEKPVADNRSEDGKSQNRRVEIVKK